MFANSAIVVFGALRVNLICKNFLSVHSLLEELLKRFENETGGTLIVATLCLLEASSAGLLESELRQILGDEEKLMPPSPFDEKGAVKLK